MSTFNDNNSLQNAFIIIGCILGIIGFICQCHNCCKALDKYARKESRVILQEDVTPRRYDAIAVANRRIPQPSNSGSINLNSSSTRTVTTNIINPTNNNNNNNNHQQRTNNGRINNSTLSTMMTTSSSNRNNNTIFTIENECSTTTDNINEALNALRIPERSQLGRREIVSNGSPPSRTLFFRGTNDEPLPPMRMPVGHFHVPTKINNEIDNDGLPSYDDVVTLQKY